MSQITMHTMLCFALLCLGDLLGEERSTSSKVCRRFTISPRAVSWLDGLLRSRLTESSSRNSPPPRRGGISLEQGRLPPMHTAYRHYKYSSAVCIALCASRTVWEDRPPAQARSRPFWAGGCCVSWTPSACCGVLRLTMKWRGG